MNKDIEVPLIYEDCTAVISLVTEGGGVVRMKHLRVRMELCKQALQEKKFVLRYISTKQMLADGLTKALEGEDFIVFAEPGRTHVRYIDGLRQPVGVEIPVYLWRTLRTT